MDESHSSVPRHARAARLWTAAAALLLLAGCGRRPGGYRSDQAHLFCANPACGHLWVMDWAGYEAAVEEAYAAGDGRGAVPCPECGQRSGIPARICVNPACGRAHDPSRVACPYCGHDPKSGAAAEP